MKACERLKQELVADEGDNQPLPPVLRLPAQAGTDAGAGQIPTSQRQKAGLCWLRILVVC